MMRIVDPVGESEQVQRKRSPRPASLDGKVIGILCNERTGSSVMTDFEGYTRQLEIELSSLYKGVRFVREFKPIKSKVSEAEVFDRLVSQADVVINGLGM